MKTSVMLFISVFLFIGSCVQSEESKIEETIKKYEIEKIKSYNGNPNTFRILNLSYIKDYTIQDSINYLASFPYISHSSNYQVLDWYEETKKTYMSEFKRLKEYPERINAFKERAIRGDINMSLSWIKNEQKSLEDNYKKLQDWYYMFHETLEGKNVEIPYKEKNLYLRMRSIVKLEAKGKETVIGKLYQALVESTYKGKRSTDLVVYLISHDLEKVLSESDDYTQGYVEPSYFKGIDKSDFPIIDKSETKIKSGLEKESSEEVNIDDLLLGTWAGDMDDKPLKIVIERVDGNELFGYNQVGENKRPVNGTFEKGSYDQPCCIAFDAVLNEPGDDKWDGVFNVKFVCFQKQSTNPSGDLVCDGEYDFGGEAIGDWVSNNGKLNRNLILNKQTKSESP